MLPESAPYWLTILVATAAWIFTTFIDQVLKTPFLTYEISNEVKPEHDGKIRTKIIIRNITEDKVYREVKLIFGVPDNDKIYSGSIVATQPGWEGPTQGTAAGRTFEHTFSEIQPGGRFELDVTHETMEFPHVQLVTKNDVILLRKPYWLTEVVENHNIINATLLLAIILFVLGYYIVFMSRNTSNKPT